MNTKVEASAGEPEFGRAEQRAARGEILSGVRWQLLGASVLQCLATAASVLPFIVIVELSRELLRGDMDVSRVWMLAGVALGFLGLRGLLSAGALLWSHLTDVRLQYELRVSLAQKLARVPLGWFGSRSSGEVKKLLQDDVSTLHHLVAHARLDVVAAVTGPVLTVGYLFWVDWRIALITLTPLVAYLVILAVVMAGGMSARFAAYNADQARVNAGVVEFLDGIQVVRLFGDSQRAHSRYRDDIDHFARNLASWSLPIARLQGAISVLLHPVFVLLVAMVAALGFTASGTFAPINLLPFLLLGLGLGNTVLTLGNGTTALSKADISAVRLRRLGHEPELPTPHGAGKALTSVRAGLVEYGDVTFSYDGVREVLSNASLRLEPGTITALVGASGAGKSTLAALLPRFHDVTGGAIRIDGIDIRQIPSMDLYRRVGFVFQQVHLVAGTARENIALPRPDAGQNEIIAAARAAQIHERIMELPRGYDSLIGQDALFSGGEAQRLALARTLLADAPVLVLDEATAFADPESEAQIQDALATVLAGRTVLVIAHRLHTITDVDQIIVLDQGKVSQRGTHAQLIAADGIYRQLWQSHAQPAPGPVSATTTEALS